MKFNPPYHCLFCVPFFSYLSIVGCAIALLSGCNKDPSGDNDGDTQPPWNQMAIDLQAAWSPDGSKIVYGRDPAEFSRDTSWLWGAFVHYVDADTDSCIWPRQLFDSFSWSPDGDKLAFTKSGQVYVYDFAANSTRQITGDNRNFSLSWSPCGDMLAFFYRSLGGGLYIYDFAADSISHYSDRNGADAGDWMPNCSTLVLMDSCRTGPCSIVTYNIYSDSLFVVSHLDGFIRDVRASPNGESAVFGIYNDLFLAEISSGEIVQLTTKGGAYPDWSPDGRWIVYTKLDRKNGYLWLMRPDGSEKHQITF